MKHRICGLVAGMFVVASVALAQNAVDGKWAGEVQGGRGPQQMARPLQKQMAAPLARRRLD